MKKFMLDELWVLAAWEPDPPLAPWRAVVPVLAPSETSDVVLWPVNMDVRRGTVFGYEEPRTSLESAIEEGRATSVGQPLRARREDVLVRRADGTFAMVRGTDALHSRLTEIKARLNRALELLDQEAPLPDIQDAFDGAFLVQSFDPVATTLRAGAATWLRDQDPDWCSQCIDDLAYAVELGADPVMVRERLPWPQLTRASLCEALYRKAREALDDHLRPKTELEPPVDIETQAAAVATAVWRRRYAKTSRVALPHEALTKVLAGDPAGVAAARTLLESDQTWRDLFLMVAATWRLGGVPAVTLIDASAAAAPAQAQIADLERFARSLHHLEQLEDGPSRSACWRGFLQRTQGLSQWKDSRPWRQGELAADELRSRLDLDGHPLAAVSTLAATNGVFVGVASLSGGDVDGAASQPRNVPPCMFVDESAARDPRLSGRFALAHELCHLLMDRNRTGSNSWVCRTASRREETALVLDEEKRANAFAAYLIAPREAVRALVPSLPTLDSGGFVSAALDVRARFGLTATTAAEHLLNCHHSLGATKPGRDKLPNHVRNRVEEAATGKTIAGFEADQNLDAGELEAPVPQTRRGRFAELLRRWVAVGQMTPDRAAELLGVEPSKLAPWLARTD